ASSVTYTLSLHDALPIFFRYRDGGQAGDLDHRVDLVDLGLDKQRVSHGESDLTVELPCEAVGVDAEPEAVPAEPPVLLDVLAGEDRKSTRLNSSHVKISY